jgi:hypothetical protein
LAQQIADPEQWPAKRDARSSTPCHLCRALPPPLPADTRHLVRCRCCHP